VANTRKQEDFMEYKKAAALARRKARQRKRNSWEKFITNLEHDLYRTPPNMYKIIKHKDIKESANVKGDIHEDTLFTVL
jgi:hypothetical protein